MVSGDSVEPPGNTDFEMRAGERACARSCLSLHANHQLSRTYDVHFLMERRKGGGKEWGLSTVLLL